MQSSPPSLVRVVIIMGSARADGDTAAKCEPLTAQMGWDYVDLNDYRIGYYEYAHEQHDDFLPLIRRLITDYDVFVLATPVYWYAMSGQLKVFLDRFTDLLTIDKPLGRQLRGKSMAVLSCSNGSNLGDAFWLPFRATAEYLGMHYLTEVHTYQNQDDVANVVTFAESIVAQTHR